LGVNERSSGGAEKNVEGMALKIRTRAEEMLDQGWLRTKWAALRIKQYKIGKNPID